jgi:hypothetical protein
MLIPSRMIQTIKTNPIGNHCPNALCFQVHHTVIEAGVKPCSFLKPTRARSC